MLYTLACAVILTAVLFYIPRHLKSSKIEHLKSRLRFFIHPVLKNPQNIEITQPSPSRSEASARESVDVVRDWDLGVTSPLNVLQNA